MGAEGGIIQSPITAKLVDCRSVNATKFVALPQFEPGSSDTEIVGLPLSLSAGSSNRSDGDTAEPRRV